ncbi:peptidylprolyl isomerase [Undibacterium pigrum]|uniref:Chaperone SurA n=1 Tax=Undibacterium pigrum TaxID=401470 RepID=A0A318J920_9BURK|nr:peptidylprolyl isomerase [Undibacterium pigrum]PXX43809.1 periplasmic chaperone for outer membrane proteins SurA [Undibacterium pigrum]
MRPLLQMKQSNLRTNLLTNLFTALAVSAGLLASTTAWSQVKLTPIAPAKVVQSKAQTVNSIVVVVNDEVITRQELNEQILAVEMSLKKQGTPLPDRAALQKQLLERMIIDRAQMQLAKENGMRVDDVMLDRTMLRLAEQNKMSLQEFRNQIEREGTSYAKFREEIRDDILKQRIREREVDSKIQVSETEIDNYLAAEANNKSAKQELNLAHILVSIPEKASAEQIAARRQRAEEALQKLRGGADFAKTAVTYSDSSEALKGGDIGWREQDRLPPLFVDAISKVKVGEFSEIVRSPNGFHIIKVNGKRAANDTKAAAAEQQSRVRHILLKVSQIVTVEEARQKLLDFKKKIEAKEATFEDLAKAHSIDGSASKGGDLGWLFPGSTLPEFEQAMDKLAINQISEPVVTQFGVHLIQVLERKTDELSKDRQRIAARQAVRDRKSDEALQDWLREVRDRAYVDYRLEDK